MNQTVDFCVGVLNCCLELRSAVRLSALARGGDYSAGLLGLVDYPQRLPTACLCWSCGRASPPPLNNAKRRCIPRIVFRGDVDELEDQISRHSQGADVSYVAGQAPCRRAPFCNGAHDRLRVDEQHCAL